MSCVHTTDYGVRNCVIPVQHSITNYYAFYRIHPRSTLPLLGGGNSGSLALEGEGWGEGEIDFRA
jgi:hypothetical protein